MKRSLTWQSQANTAVHGGSTRNNKHIEAIEIQITREELFHYEDSDSEKGFPKRKHSLYS